MEHDSIDYDCAQPCDVAFMNRRNHYLVKRPKNNIILAARTAQRDHHDATVDYGGSLPQDHWRVLGERMKRVLIRGILLLLACAVAAFAGFVLAYGNEERIYPYVAQSSVCDVFRSAERQEIVSPNRRPVMSAKLADSLDLDESMRLVMRRVQLGCGAILPVQPK